MRVLLVILLLVCLLAGALFLAATAITPSGDDVLDAITAVSAPADPEVSAVAPAVSAAAPAVIAPAVTAPVDLAVTA